MLAPAQHHPDIELELGADLPPRSDHRTQYPHPPAEECSDFLPLAALTEEEVEATIGWDATEPVGHPLLPPAIGLHPWMCTEQGAESRPSGRNAENADEVVGTLRHEARVPPQVRDH